jgi:acyl carrier protein
MSLEADLGIDSIKRVEIMGGVRERLPGLPEVDAMQLAQLSTLGEVIAALDQGAPASAAPFAPSADVSAAFLAVVAEKTGYPQEALSLHMSLEADLGIDSIKRVEIMGGVRERLPGLPEVDAMQLAQLGTLGEVIAALGGGAATAPSLAKAPLPSAGAVQRAEVALAPVTTTRDPLALPAAARVLVTGGDAELRSAVRAALLSRGLSPEFLAEDIPEATVGLIDLGGLDDVRDHEGALSALRASFDAARRAARPLQAAAAGAFYCVVQDTDGELGLGGRAGARALLGGLAALAKTAAQEWPTVRVKALEVRRSERAAAQLATLIIEEALAGADAVEVAAHGEARLTLVTRQAALPAGVAPALGERPVIVATGGARGVTATSLEALLERGPARLVLLGRTDMERELSRPEASLTDEGELKRALLDATRARSEGTSLAEVGAMAGRIRAAQDIATQLERFRAKGAEVLYLPVDVRDAEALKGALARARDVFGPLTGLVHGAGILADKRLEDKSLEQFDRVVDTKLRGLLALLEATALDPLRFIALFSSVAGRFGNVGQADYAMANEAMSKLAQCEQQRRGAACLVKSYAWGPWDGGMVTPALQKLFEERGVSLLSLEAGARFFVEELSSAAAERGVEVVFGGPLTGEPSDEGDDATHIDSRGFDFLKDHALRGTPVLPVVMAVELVAQAARRRHPGLVLRRLHSLRVLRGVPLKGFYNGGNQLRVVLAAKDPNGSGAEVALLAEVFADGDPVARYTAVVELGRTLEVAGEAPAPPAALERFNVDRAAIYRDLLFHGPSFQLVDEVEGISAAGIVGRVRGTRLAGWGERPFDVDVGALDAGLQLALLYGRHALNGAFLPTGFGRFVPFAGGLLEGSLRCVVNASAEGKDRVRADVSFVDEGGRLLMQLKGLELHRLLDDKAFTSRDERAAVPAAS